MDPLEIPAGAVSIESGYAISVARKYVELVEAQFSQAESDMPSVALEAFRRVINRDESDYDSQVRDVQRRFEDDYGSILRSTEVIYLYAIFETFVSRHVAAIEALRGKGPRILKRLKRRSGLTKAVRTYFQEQVRWQLLDDEAWFALGAIGAVRNCIVHNAGVVRGTRDAEDIYSLEQRQAIGIKILRYDDGRDAGQPIIIHQAFVEYYLGLLKKLFDAIERKVTVYRQRHK